MWKDVWYCRWCGYEYKPENETDRDGFCCSAHKQAHHRAYKKYVTWISTRPAALAARAGSRRRCRVTQKKTVTKKKLDKVGMKKVSYDMRGSKSGLEANNLPGRFFVCPRPIFKNFFFKGY